MATTTAVCDVPCTQAPEGAGCKPRRKSRPKKFNPVLCSRFACRPEWIWQGSKSLGESARVFAGQLGGGGYGAPISFNSFNDGDKMAQVQDDPSRYGSFYCVKAVLPELN